MDTVIRIISFIAMIISFCGVFYVFRINKDVRKMQVVNDGISEYVKEESFKFMKNGGDNPCDTKEKFDIPSFSQDGNYYVRRKMKWPP